MLAILEQLNDIGWTTVFLVVLLIVILFPQAVEAWTKFWNLILNFAGKEIKKSYLDKQKEKDLKEFKNTIKEEQLNFQRNMIEIQRTYHEQSITIRNELINKQKEFERQQLEMKSNMIDFKKILKEYIENDTESKIAILRKDLWRMHRDFTTQGYITPDGLKTFNELGNVYISYGGNDIFHNKLKPEIEKLEIRYPDEFS